MAAVLKLLITIGLGAAYLAVAFAAAHPHVTPEYAAHYLHRTADCWEPQAKRAGGVAEAPPPDTIMVADLAYPEACRYLRVGWDVTEDWGAWADPKHATLHLRPKLGARVVALTVRAAPLPGPAIRARFSLSGQDVEKVIPAGATRIVILPLPLDGADVEIRSPDYAVIPSLPPDARTRHVNPVLFRDHPPSTTTRHVGVGLIAIHYLPGQPAPMPPHAG